MTNKKRAKSAVNHVTVKIECESKYIIQIIAINFGVKIHTGPCEIVCLHMCLKIKPKLCHLFRNINKISNDFVLVQKWVCQTSNVLLFVSYNPCCELYKNDSVEFAFASAVHVCEPSRNIIMTFMIIILLYCQYNLILITAFSYIENHFFGYVTYFRVYYQIFDIFKRKIIWIDVTLWCFTNHGDRYKL